jgi:hypothetical protein
VGPVFRAAKVFLRCRTKILRAADPFYARRCEGPKSVGPKSITDLRSGAKKRRSSREVQRSTFARFLGLFDFRLLQQYRPHPDIARPTGKQETEPKSSKISQNRVRFSQDRKSADLIRSPRRRAPSRQTRNKLLEKPDALLRHGLLAADRVNDVSGGLQAGSVPR